MPTECDCSPSANLANVLAKVMFEPGQATRHVWLPVDGFVSLITLTDGSPGLEVGMVGREGMPGAQLALGVSSAPMEGFSHDKVRQALLGAGA